MPNKADPDVWIKPAVKPDGSEYYEIVLCYVDDVLSISDDPMKTIYGIKSVFKLKGDKAETPDMYLGATIQNRENADGTNCWTITKGRTLAGSLPYIWILEASTKKETIL